jgi:hypothetical protein
MGSVTYSGNTTAGQNGGVVLTGGLPQFTGNWTATVATQDGSANPGATINFRIDFIRSSDGFVCYSIGVSIVGAPSNSVGYSVPNTGGTYSALDWDTVRLRIESALGTPAKTWELTVTANFAPTVYCAYGTEANPSAQVYETLTDVTIDLVVGAALAGTGDPVLIAAVETALAGIEGAIWFGVDCSTLPNPNQESLDLTNIQNWAPDRLLAWFQTAAWHFFCQCKAAPTGQRPPIRPPAPPVVRPPVIAPQPPLVCDASDICTYLTALSGKLDSLTRQVSYLRSDVILIQRQKVPFAYVRGTLHSGLTGTGTLAVQGILALSVQVTTMPIAASQDVAAATDYYQLGKVSVGTVDGWQRVRWITHNPMLIDQIDGDITLVGYWFPPGVVASIQELVREP